MENNAEISERVKQVIDYLSLNASKFGKALGYERVQTIYDILSGKSAPSFDFFKRFQSSEYSEQVNMKWLLTGIGELNNGSNSNQAIVNSSLRDNIGLIPLIPINAVAGISNGLNSAVLTVDCEYYDVPEFKNKADYLIRVNGSSMSPKYHSGDIVACKKLPLDTFFQWNKVYVLDTEQGALVKRVKKSDLGIEFIQLISENEKYEAFDIPKSSIHALGLVIGVIRLE